ncbi:restriction endonuclease subunit R [Romeria aff. gracilis LEGE 07310]|uniref:Restriction endonuclease subunit R n=1 Tax=Vasconcelosia minhoensis LEGE 07310 TaxID=915328 RepID=A0A8J7A6G1_9CYAN|nr:restriction endonuclease subunit R [Romeria gracilis]MBE9076765.1 restriction endonuclease subunit R [Romeria aff. gracilis LEGE 07310]
MVRVLQATQLTLHDVKTKFGLQPETEPDFFTEWQVPPPALNDYQRQLLDQTQADYIYWTDYPIHEELVKMVVVSPLLSVAGFYKSPFRPVAEKTIEIEIEATETDAEDEIVRGRIDILVLNEQLWVTTVEAKGPQFSWLVGLPQTLTYMASSDQPTPTRFGMITNGADFIFVKLRKDMGQYGLSKPFSLFNPGNDLYEVVGVLRSVSH